jgi:hypothetical protein
MLLTLLIVVIINIFVFETLLYDKLTVTNQIVGINNGDFLIVNNNTIVCNNQTYCLQQMCLLNYVDNVSSIILIPTFPTTKPNCNTTVSNNFNDIYHDMKSVIITYIALNIIAMVLVFLAGVSRCCKHEDTYVVLVLLNIPIFLISVFIMIMTIVENLIAAKAVTNYKFVQNIIILFFYLVLQLLCLLSCINNFTTIKYIQHSDVDELIATTI